MPSPNSPALSKKVLVPLWSLQLLCTIGNLGTYLWITHAMASHDWEFDVVYPGSSYNIEKSFLFVSDICLIITNICVVGLIVLQMYKFRNNTLDAKTMLGYQVALTAYALIAWIIIMLGLYGVLVGGFKSILDFAFTTSALAFFLGSLIYGAVVYSRENKARKDAMPAYEEHALPSYDDLTPFRKQDSLAKGSIRASEDDV